MTVAQLLPILLLVVFAYLLLIRPARKRAAEATALQAALSTGDEVMLTSGIFGRVESLVDDATVAVEISPGVVLRVHRGAIGKIVDDSPPTYGDDDTEVATGTSSTETTGSSMQGQQAAGIPGSDAELSPDDDSRREAN